MRKLLITALGFLMCNKALSQQRSLDDINRQRLNLNKNAMLTVGSWSAANIVYGTIASTQTTGTTKYFHQMNAIWNGFTLGLVATTSLLAKKEEGLTLEQSRKKQSGAEKMFLVNTGLDVAYIAGGLYMKERSKNSVDSRDKLKGYGESIVLQGAALLMFDGLVYVLHHKNGKPIFKLAEKASLSAGPGGIGVNVAL